MSTRFTRDGLVHEHSDTCSHAPTVDLPPLDHCTCIWAVNVYLEPTLCPTHGTQSCLSISNPAVCDIHYQRIVLYDKRTNQPVQ